MDHNISDTLRFRLWYWLTHPGAFLGRLQAEVYKRRHPEEPWISHHAVKFCQQALRSNMRGLEWGSGRSTAWYAKRLGSLCSVEHNQDWHRIVTVKLREQGAANVDYRFVPLEHSEREPALAWYPQAPRYVSVADDFADESLDFVVVDGHYRQACVRAALGKLRSGGLLLVDNSNWMKLSDWGVPGHWPVAHRSFGYEGETTIWRKP